MKQILTGLAEMHEKNVWHRDVTPGNLLLTADDTVKFIDFGISKLAEEKQMLEQEKHIVVDFMHNMVEAVIEDGTRNEMFQRIIHAAVLSTDAMSACIFEKQAGDTLKGVAIEGLFPPQRKEDLISEDTYFQFDPIL